MQHRWTVAAAVGAVAGFVVVPPVLAGNEDLKNKYPNTTITRDCGDQDTVVYGGPEKLWPPNHKLQTVQVTATDGGSDNGSDQTTLDVADITVTDVAGADGGPQHDPDVFYPDGPTASGSPSAAVPVQLRSERSGRGDGRTYTLDWVATFDGSQKTCTSKDAGQSPFTVFVPHDMRGGADWK